MTDRIYIANAVIVKDGLLFAIKRGDHPCKGMYALPGGVVESGEKYYETVIREVFEETGLIVNAIADDTLGSVDIDVGPLHGNATYVKATITGGEIKLLEGEIEGYKWISLKDFIAGHYIYGFNESGIKEIESVVSQAITTKK